MCFSKESPLKLGKAKGPLNFGNQNIMDQIGISTLVNSFTDQIQMPFGLCKRMMIRLFDKAVLLIWVLDYAAPFSQQIKVDHSFDPKTYVDD